MRSKWAAILAFAVLSAAVVNAKDDNEEAARSPAKWRPKPWRICTSCSLEQRRRSRNQPDSEWYQDFPTPICQQLHQLALNALKTYKFMRRRQWI